MLKGLERVESIAYKLKLPQELSRVHNTFHISNLKKCCSDDPLAIPLEGLHIDDKFHLVEEPVVIMDRDIKRLKSKPICKTILDESNDSQHSRAAIVDELMVVGDEKIRVVKRERLRDIRYLRAVLSKPSSINSGTSSTKFLQQYELSLVPHLTLNPYAKEYSEP
ncbi:hypothetical protein Tco_0442267 [Tanacetum coccineum]